METSSATEQRDLQLAFQQALADEGRVRFDPYQRELYSTDASNHRLVPLGVVIPNSQDELSIIAATAARLNVPILPRGAGTSLAGQAIGHAVIIDCGKNLTDIIHLDPEQQTAVVEPGVTCIQLNKAAAAHGLMFGPDPASADRATFGGMIGNNATGAHSIRYGMMADHLRRLWVTLADGSETVFEQLGAEEWATRAKDPGLEGQIYRAAARVRREYTEVLKSSWPRTWRRASGYSLNYLIGYSPSRPPAWPANRLYPDHDPSNLAPVLAGSEGTLALFRQAEVRLVPTPKAKVLVLIPANSVLEAVKRVPALLEARPAAVELIPRTLLERAAAIPAYARKLTFLESIPEALLAVEFSGNSVQEARRQALEASAGGILLDDVASQSNLWDVRKAGLGLLMSVPGGEKPITFIEDVAVPIDRLADYVERVERILVEHNTQAAWYAHASAGCLHLRPMINLRTQRGVERMRSIADRVAEVVLELGGAMSGEHGDGLSHTEFNQLLFGPTTMQAFHEIKRAFDPQDILNPGKIVPSSRAVQPSLDQHLRFGGNYSATNIDTYFSHTRAGGLAGEVEACVGLGVCRKNEGLMCPSYQATREEADVTRGRANALRAALAGQLPSDALTSKEMYRIYDLCLECKGCKAECPTGVDIARVKAEFLSLYGQEHGFSLRSRIFANIRSVSHMIHWLGPLIHVVSEWPVFRWFQEVVLGVSRQRVLPPFQRQRFSSWYRGRGSLSETQTREKVVLFLDTYTEYSYPSVGKAAVQVLEAAGRKVVLERRHECCGRPMISKGFLADAKELARRNIQVLHPWVEAGYPILVLEPSCLSALRDEYLEFFPDDPRARELAGGCFAIEEYLAGDDAADNLIGMLDYTEEPAAPLKLHTHCHAKALTGSSAMHSMLSVAGYSVEEIDSGCCGMAGSFGYEQEHYALSMQVGELKVLPAARSAEAAGEILAAHGVSCRTQISDGTGTKPRHPIELVADRLRDEDSSSKR